MKNVKPFIDLGFYVVPLNGVITRLKNGKKQVPPFPGPWKQLYLEQPYEPEKEEPIAITGAMICGKRSGAVSIDCDDQATYDIFKALDPTYDFAFVSKDKPSGGASIIYRIPEEFVELPTFRVKSDFMHLDFQTNDSLQFLPTLGNKTKVEWLMDDFAELPELTYPPKTIIDLILNIHDLHTKSKALTTPDGRVTQAASEKHYKYLAPFIKAFLKSGKFDNELFRILTPKEGGFRNLPQYQKDGTLHPDNVPDGMGNDYLTSIAGVLATDSSVSPDLLKQMLTAVNMMWTSPLEKKDIEERIKYQLKRDQWAYDKDWKDKVSMVLTEYGTLVRVFYDPLSRIYYALDDKLGMGTFDSIDQLPKHLNSIVKGQRKYTTGEIYDYLDKKQTIFTPLEPYGELPPLNEVTSLRRHNLFQRSRAFDILLRPEAYHDEFRNKVPKVTIAFFRHLIPDDDIRDYVLRFVLTKLQTLKFSEVVLYLLGKQGAGKNLFVDWLAKFTENSATQMQNNDYKMVVEVDLDNFLAKYNLWIVNALFANLDEYGEKTSSVNEDKRVLAQLKSYTGKEQIQLRTMNNNPTPAQHKCTFILTANENRLAPDLEDRRLVLIDTPEPLANAKFVKDIGGKSEAISLLFEEQLLWAYYWATNYSQLSHDEYRTPPESEFKKKLILRHLPASKKIAAIIQNQDTGSFIALCEDNDFMQELLDDAKYGAVSKQLIVDLFLAITQGTAARKAMIDKSLRDMDIKVIKIRFGARQAYGVPFPSLKIWASKLTMQDGVLLSGENDGEDSES